LVFGGEIKDPVLFRRRLEEADLVLAADSGAGHALRAGIFPSLVYGDMDSLTAGEISLLEEGGCRFIVSPEEKDDTDGAIAFKEALNMGFKDIRIWGALGGRPDHSYANIMLLQLALAPAYQGGGLPQDGKNADVVIEDGGVRVFLPKRGQWIEGKTGSYLSIFALTPEVTGFTQTGLKYQPAGGRYVNHFPLGISNEFIKEKVYLNWENGIIMCMQIDV
jgi:thiamine pyrophosphokinase